MPLNLSNPSFLLLVEKAQARDPFAFDQLVRRFQDRAVGYASTLLGDDRASAEDAAQEAFLEVYRCLIGLKLPAAFPGWLRRLVFKHCDRVRRGKPERAVSLESVQYRLYDEADLETDLVRQQEAEQVRAAIHALPCGERAVTTLFYLSGCPTREIAAFLEVPEATVRIRLHRARLRLRKELIVKELGTRDIKPAGVVAQNPVAERVFGEIVADYLKQQSVNPEAADRSLLAQARQQLNDRLQDDTPLDSETVRSGDNLFSLIGEHEGSLALMRRYLTQSLPVSEEAWARFFLVNALSAAGRSEEVVAAQEALSQWVMSVISTDPPRLTRNWPFLPIADTDSVTEIYPQDSLLLWTHYIPEAPSNWIKVGRGDDWLRRFHEILDATPATKENRQQRFYFMRIALRLLVDMWKAEEAEKVLLRVETLADEETDPLSVFHWRGHALYLRMVQAKDDFESFHQAGNRAAVLLSMYEQALRAEASSSGAANCFSILRDNIASIAADHGLYTLAVPLLTILIASGRASEWVYIRLAKCVWAITRDRTDTLSLLPQGAVRNEAGDLWDWVKTLPVFAGIAEDEEFVAAFRHL